MAELLLAVLVAATATADTIDAHLAAPLRPLLRAQVITSYRLDHTPTTDNHRAPTAPTPSRPRRWLPSRRRRAATTIGRPGCRLVRPGDLVALAALLTGGWQFPVRATPHAWVDLSGVVWLGTDARRVLGTDDGAVPTRLRTVLADLAAGRRQPDPTAPRPPDPYRWQVALVHATG